MVDQIKKPGVEIKQSFTTTPSPAVIPTLAPCIVGPAFEVVDLVDDNGSPSVESKVQVTTGDLQYRQVPTTINVSDYPAPRADKAQMSVLADEVDVALARSGAFDVLSSSAFLTDLNVAQMPGLFMSDAIVTSILSGTLLVSVNAPAADTSAVQVLAIPASAADFITGVENDLAGVRASAVTLDGVSGVVLYAERAGASASITLFSSALGQASGVVATAVAGASTIRNEGAGLKAANNPAAGSTTSSYIDFTQGTPLVDRIAPSDAQLTALNTAGWEFVQVKELDGELVLTSHANVQDIDFVNDLRIQAATATRNGDLLTASGPFGQSISSVMVTGVTSSRIKLGVVDTARSEYNADGSIAYQRYLDFQLGELTENALPFAPRYGYIIAQELHTMRSIAFDGGNAVLESSDVSGSVTAATQAEVSIAGDVAFVASDFSGVSFTLTLAVDDAVTQYDIIVPDGDNTAFANHIQDITGGAVSVTGFAPLTFQSFVAGDHIGLSLSGTLVDVLGNEPVFTPGTNDVLPGMAGKSLKFSFNGGRQVYEVFAVSADINEFTSRVNDAVGADVLSFDGTGTFTLQSYLIGVASDVSVHDSDLKAVLGFDAAVLTEGSGRPNPDVFVEADGTIHVGGDVMRHSVTGQPVSGATNSARVHVAYRALRLDLSPIANQPGVISVSSVSDLETIYGPVDTRNPLALGIYFALLNMGDGQTVTALGVSDVSSSEPDGTLASYAEALEMLRSYEVYSLIPLTRSEDVIALCDTHVSNMSEPAQRAERMLISAPINPVRYNDEVVLGRSTDGAESTGNADQVDLNDSPEATLAGLGVDTAQEIPFELTDGRQLFLTITVGGSTRRYSVKSVDGARVTIRRSLSSAQNPDGFFSTEALPSEFVAADFSLALRGTLLTLPGSAKLDKLAYAQTIRDKAQQYLNRRHVRLYPDTVQSSAINGVNQAIESFYYAAALSGAVAQIAAQEPLTRVALVGFNDVLGPSLERNHLNIISAGNAVIEVESSGLAPALRMQGTTDPSSIESREWSITRAVDSFAKTLRAQLKSRIGRFNITQAYLDNLSVICDGACSVAVSSGLFEGATVSKIEQSKAQPDLIVIQVTLEVLYPANYIEVTLVV